MSEPDKNERLCYLPSWESIVPLENLRPTNNHTFLSTGITDQLSLDIDSLTFQFFENHKYRENCVFRVRILTSWATHVICINLMMFAHFSKMDKRLN